jgi:phosphatidylserine/phosphatidylglycerophosphate/cardiolipin synthase-like enzyme
VNLDRAKLDRRSRTLSALLLPFSVSSVTSVSSVFLLFALALPPEVEAKPSAAQVEAAFTPGDDIAGIIRGHIARAKASVRMQAYLLTDRTIAMALLGACKRGLEVEVIGDAAQFESGGLPWLGALDRAGARVYLNTSHAASHNKIVIIDGGLPGATVITGSYNFTQAAQSKNAENIVIISRSPAVTDRFVENFADQRSLSRPWP